MVVIAKCVGCGLVVNSGILEVDLVGNGTTGALSCSNSGTDPGLNVRLCPNAGIVLDTTCGLKIQFPASTDGGTNSIIPFGSCLASDAAGKINPKLSADACNGLVCRANGLYSPCPDSLAGAIVQPGKGTPTPIGLTAGGTYTMLTSCESAAAVGIPSVAGFGENGEVTCQATPSDGLGGLQLCNPLCCLASGNWNVQAGGGIIDSASASFVAEAELGVTFDTGATYGSAPQPIQRFQNGIAGSRFYISGLQDFNYVLLAPGQCIMFKARVQIRVISGTATLVRVPDFEIRWQLNQVGCCPPAG